jgi:hypothetical protein
LVDALNDAQLTDMTGKDDLRSDDAAACARFWDNAQVVKTCCLIQRGPDVFIVIATKRVAAALAVFTWF